MVGESQQQDPRQAESPLPETMQAVVLSGIGPSNLSCQEIPVPQVGPNQLLARVDAAGVCSSILKVLSQGSKHTFLNGWNLEQFPIILGDEGAVTLVKVGENLRGEYEAGQRFGIQPAVDVAPINHRERYTDGAAGMKKCAVGYTLNGCLAQYILIQEEILQGNCLLTLPHDQLPYFSVSMAEPISCVYSAQQRHVHIYKESPFEERVSRLGLLRGGTTVIIGAGVMGRMHLEMAVRFRPRHLIISDLVQDRLDKALKAVEQKGKELGIAVAAVQADELEAFVHCLTDGAGADDIVLAVGIQSVQQQALGLLGKGGVANLFGGLPRGQHLLQLDAIAVHYDEIRVVGSSGGEPSDLKATLDAIACQDIDPGKYVCAVGALPHAPNVLQMMGENKVDGKVILYPHTHTSQLNWVDSWDKAKEEHFLREHQKAEHSGSRVH